MTGLQLVSMGRALPERIVTNDDMARLVETSDEWIASRTGIRSRRFAGEGENNLSLASAAAREAIDRAGIDPDEIAVCIVATFTPDTFTPSVACGVAGRAGLPESVFCIDINGACTGFIYSLQAAHSLLAAYPDKYALVIGSEVVSRVMDMTDRSTCVLFGDGAGAALVRRSDSHPFAFAGGCKPDEHILRCDARKPAIEMDGSAVFRFAVEVIPETVQQLLGKVSLTLDDIDHVVCHQANSRIIDAAARRMKIAHDKMFMNLQSYGNTSAASIPLALYELEPKAGSRVVCVGFGAGLTYGAALLTL